jgi:transposase
VSQIQALDRTQPGLPMKSGRAGTMTHDYKTPWYHAVRRPQRAPWHRHRTQHEAPSPSGVHPFPKRHRGAGAKTKGHPRHRRQLRHPQISKVRVWLARHPRWTFHFTPTSASWLNAVEGFFAKLMRRRLQVASSDPWTN